MSAWLVAGAVVLFLVALVLLALLVLDERRLADRRSLPPPVPRPADLRHVRFRTVLGGYDPVEVDDWLVAAADAWDTLAAVAGHEAISEAEARVGGSDGLDQPWWREGVERVGRDAPEGEETSDPEVGSSPGDAS